MYKTFIRPILFRFDAEQVHHFSFAAIKFLHKIPLVSVLTKRLFTVSDKRLERTVAGIKFPNPVGLAAGFDKDAKLYSELSNFGFGFIEIGTVTPKPQSGNDKPRLFRLLQDEAIINRMGFNNSGLEEVAQRLRRPRQVIVGGNIGKNKATPNELAASDYMTSFQALHDLVDYFVVNVSSPNTPNLRELQEKQPLTQLLNALQVENQLKQLPKPIFLKIAPDLTESQLLDIIEIVSTTKIAGVIATNTTISREGLESDNKSEIGGLSGLPLAKKSTEVIHFLHKNSNGSFPIIGVGGIHSASDAIEKLDAGACLVQLYTGFVYEGPAVVKKINQEILKRYPN